MAGEGEAGDRGGRDNILAFENVKRLGSVKTVMLTVMILQTFNSSPRPFSFKRRGAFLPSLFKRGAGGEFKNEHNLFNTIEIFIP